MKMSDRRTIGLNCFRERTVGKFCTGYKFRCSERDQLSGVRQ